jgi:hypothetical protein
MTTKTPHRPPPSPRPASSSRPGPIKRVQDLTRDSPPPLQPLLCFLHALKHRALSELCHCYLLTIAGLPPSPRPLFRHMVRTAVTPSPCLCHAASALVSLLATTAVSPPWTGTVPRSTCYEPGLLIFSYENNSKFLVNSRSLHRGPCILCKSRSSP